jgi:hypothetical protein
VIRLDCVSSRIRGAGVTMCSYSTWAATACRQLASTHRHRMFSLARQVKGQSVMLIRHLVFTLLLSSILFDVAPAHADPALNPAYNGQISFDNLAQFPDYLMVFHRMRSGMGLHGELGDSLGRLRDVHPDDIFQPCALKKSIYDSVYVNTDIHRGRAAKVAVFLRTDPRILCSNSTFHIYRGNPLEESCERVEAVYHITRLDSATFAVAPVKTVFHLRDGQLREVTAREDSLAAAKQARQDAPQPAFSPVVLASILATLVALFAAIVLFRRKRRPNA